MQSKHLCTYSGGQYNSNKKASFQYIRFRLFHILIKMTLWWKNNFGRQQTFLSSIFGGTKEEVTTKKQVYLDDNGTIIRTETEPVDNDEDLEEKKKKEKVTNMENNEFWVSEANKNENRGQKFSDVNKFLLSQTQWLKL